MLSLLSYSCARLHFVARLQDTFCSMPPWAIIDFFWDKYTFLPMDFGDRNIAPQTLNFESFHPWTFDIVHIAPFCQISYKLGRKMADLTGMWFFCLQFYIYIPNSSLYQIFEEGSCWGYKRKITGPKQSGCIVHLSWREIWKKGAIYRMSKVKDWNVSKLKV